MSRRASVALMAVLILAAFAVSAHAQGVSSTVVSLFFGAGSATGPQPISATYVDADFSGSVVVSFHGDPATGCAREGLCGYSGVIVWRPTNTPSSSDASLQIIKFRQHHRIFYDAQLSTSADPFSGSSVFSHTRRDVAGGTPGTCADASTSSSNSSLRVRDGSVSIRILGSGSSVFASRCAGPLDADLVGAMPAPSLPLSAALKGRRSIDLGGTHDFASGGFAGTMHSTLVLHLLGSQTNPLLGTGNAPARRAARLRVVSEPLSLVRSTGALSLAIRGAANPDVCSVLDSCGARGTITLKPQPVSPQGALEAIGSARLPYRDFLAALGLSRRGRVRGIVVNGFLVWDRGGTLSSSLTQNSQCSWTGPLGPGVVLLSPSRGVLSARYLGLGALEHRCPGPEIGSNADAIGSGTASLHARLTSPLTLRLRTVGTFSDDGYTGRGSGSLSLTLKRGRLHQQRLGN